MATASKIGTALNLVRHNTLQGHLQALNYMKEQNVSKELIIRKFTECSNAFMGISGAKLSQCK